MLLVNHDRLADHAEQGAGSFEMTRIGELAFANTSHAAAQYTGRVRHGAHHRDFAAQRLQQNPANLSGPQHRHAFSRKVRDHVASKYTSASACNDFRSFAWDAVL